MKIAGKVMKVPETVTAKKMITPKTRRMMNSMNA